LRSPEAQKAVSRKLHTSGSEPVRQTAAHEERFGISLRVKAQGTIDEAIRNEFIAITRTPEFARDIAKYNAAARLLRQKQSATVAEIAKVLEEDVTCAKTSNGKAALFVRPKHPAATEYWLQGNPLTRYGKRVGRHELTHLGAAIRGQKNRFWHEIAVQYATTPELLALKVGIIVFVLADGYYYLIKK
jgi:hypothetical protein